MKAKLTLTVDEKAVKEVKRLARKRGVSVSSLFEQWSLKETGLDKGNRKLLTESLRGAWLDGGEGADSDDVRLQTLLEKHGK